MSHVSFNINIPLWALILMIAIFAFQSLVQIGQLYVNNKKIQQKLDEVRAVREALKPKVSSNPNVH